MQVRRDAGRARRDLCGAGRLRRRAASSSAWTVSATSRASGVTVSSSSWLIVGVDACAGDRLAWRRVSLDVLARAVGSPGRARRGVGGSGRSSGCRSGRRRRGLAAVRGLRGRAAGAVLTVRAGVLGERSQVLLELLPGEVARVRVRDQRRPLVARLSRCEVTLPSGVLRFGGGHTRTRPHTWGCAASAAPASGASSAPRELAGAMTFADPGREQQLLARRTP